MVCFLRDLQANVYSYKQTSQTDNNAYIIDIELIRFHGQFLVSQIEYPLRDSSKKGSHVYFMLQVFWVILLFDVNVVLMLRW